MICSSKMNLASWSKLCPGALKCLSKASPVGWLTSCRWVLNLKWAGGSDLPTYWCRGHFRQYPKYRQYGLRQFKECWISNSSPVWSLEKVFVVVSCRQHLFLLLDRHGVHPLNLVGFFGSAFFPLEMWTWPKICLRFLFLWYANTGLSENAGDNPGWV